MTFLWILHLFCCCGCLVHPSHAWFTFSPAGRQQPISVVPANVKVLILPGFGNDSSDYYLPQVSQGSLVQSLKSRGWKDEQIRVLPLKRQEWFNVFLRGILDHQFWLGTAPPTRPAFRWYLEKVANSIEELTTGETGNNPKVLLVCHSAGGWLARAALGYGSRDYDTEFAIDLSNVCGVVTLGAPHLPPPPEIMDMTRGALRLTNENFPGAHHANDRIFYMTIVGDAVRGIKQERTNPFEATSVTGFAYNSYEAVCGNGIAIGDGTYMRSNAFVFGLIFVWFRFF